MEDDHDALVCQFMQVTACISLSDAAQHLASCSWRLDEAVNLYFAGGAASSAPVVPRTSLLCALPSLPAPRQLYGPSSSTARRQPAGGESAAHQEIRDVGATELVARAVRERFVLWQVDVDEREDGLDEGGKGSCYYKLAHDMMPHVLVVDPVTGELVHRMRAATDPNDMIAVAEKFAERRPVMPAKATKHRAGSSLAPPPRGKQEAPPVGSAASSSSNPSSEIAPCERKLGTTATKQVETVVDAGATPTCEMAPGPGEKLCKLRVRLPDGRALTKQFGAERGVGALFAFCRSEEERPFRLMRLAGGSMQQIGDENVSFDDLGLHMSTVFMVLC
uniref:Uncharacterized protein n=1 Tax=Aegilops tauschii TaxID=37682 RepID=M8BQ95_AEGTA